jgi:hypothetical protein
MSKHDCRFVALIFRFEETFTTYFLDRSVNPENIVSIFSTLHVNIKSAKAK